MNESLPPSPAPVPPSSPSPAPGAAGAPVARRRPWLLYGCGFLLALVLAIVATVAITIWYIQRPIKPVVLSPEEKTVVEAKLKRAGEVPNPGPATATAEGRVVKVEPADPTYVPGSKQLRLTERELNGLLNANTELGNTVRLELGRDAINAYLAAPIPEDVPVFGGRMFRARGRFRISISTGAAPVAILEDVTVFGLSLPKDWLGGIKGENLLGDAVGKQNGEPILRGVKSLRVEPGALVLEVTD